MITWLASYPKSGSTWMRMFLHAYSYGDLDINDLREFDSDDLGYYEWHRVSHKPVKELSPDEGGALRAPVFMHMIHAAHGRELYVKTHSALGVASGYPLIPDLVTRKALLVVRDPRDVAVAWAHHTQQPMDKVVDFMADDASIFTKDLGRYNVVGSWSKHTASWLAAGGMIEGATKKWPVLAVTYEAMKAAPVETFSRVVEYLGWGLDHDRVKEAVRLCSFKRLQDQERTKGFKEAAGEQVFFRQGRTGAWREVLTDEQATAIALRHRGMMERFGYEG